LEYGTSEIRSVASPYVGQQARQLANCKVAEVNVNQPKEKTTKTARGMLRARVLLWWSSVVLLLRALAATTSPAVRGVWAEGKRARAASTSPARVAEVEVVAAGSIGVEDFVAGTGPRAKDARLGDGFVRWLDTHDDVEAARRLAVVAHEEEALELWQQAERIRAVEDFLVELLPICNIFHLVTSTFGLVSATPRRASAQAASAPSTHAHHAR
jgi:hypothetical protein